MGKKYVFAFKNIWYVAVVEKESGKIVLPGFPIGEVRNVVTYEIIQKKIVITQGYHPFLHFTETQIAKLINAPLARLPNTLEKIAITLMTFSLSSK